MNVSPIFVKHKSSHFYIYRDFLLNNKNSQYGYFNNKSSIHLRYDLDFKSGVALNNLHLFQKFEPICVFKTIVGLKEL